MRIGLSGGMSTPEIRGMWSPIQGQGAGARGERKSSSSLAPCPLALLLSLLLLVLGVRADHAHDALAANDLAVLTNPSHAGAYLHDCTLLPITPLPACAGRIGPYS